MENILGRQLWSIYEGLKRDNKIGFLTDYEFQKYYLGFISYKYLSLKLEVYANNELKGDNLSFEEAYKHDDFKEYLREKAIEDIGYFLKPSLLFKNIVSSKNYGTIIIEELDKAFKEISDSSIGRESQEDFQNLFEGVDLNASQLGKTLEDKNRVVFNILDALTLVDFDLEQEYYESSIENIIGGSFEYLLSKFSLNLSNLIDYYTPKEVSLLISKLISSQKNKLASVYDPCCGSASLLLEISKELPCDFICGQEINASIYNIARENMILHNIHYKDFDIKQGDSLEQPQHLKYTFDAIVCEIPFNIKWTADKRFLDDRRFKDFNALAPRTKADYAFIQHMLYHLNDDGIMMIVVPHGILFRAAAEGRIRKMLVGKLNYLDAVIGLPANMFYSTNIPTCLMIFKKNRSLDDDVLFIDASRDFNKFKLINNLREEDIYKIVNTYKFREEIDRYSHKASLEEIKENDFNLNIPRYVDTYEAEEMISAEDLVKRHQEVSDEIKEVTKEIETMYKELNIKDMLLD